MLSDRQKERLLAAVELIDPKKPGELYLLIKKYMEQNDDLDAFFDEQPTPVRIHNVQQECTACEG